MRADGAATEPGAVEERFAAARISGGVYEMVRVTAMVLLVGAMATGGDVKVSCGRTGGYVGVAADAFAMAAMPMG